MKKLLSLLILIALLIPWTSWAQCTEEAPCPELARLSPAIVGGGVPAAAPAETYALHIEFDYDTDWATATTYTTGGEDYPDGVAITVTNPGTGSVQSSDWAVSGTYSFSNPVAATGKFTIPITTKNYFDSAAGFIQMVVKIPTTTGVNQIFEARYGSADNLYVQLTAGRLIYAYYTGDNGGTQKAITHDDNADAYTDNVAFIVQVRWSVALASFSSRLCASTGCTTESWRESNDTDLPSMVSFSDEPTTIIIGKGNSTQTDDYFIDNFSIWTNYTGPG